MKRSQGLTLKHYSHKNKGKEERKKLIGKKIMIKIKMKQLLKQVKEI